MSSMPAAPTDLPSPPFINVVGIANFRDVGGYPCGDGDKPSSVRRDLVFRCADPSKVQPEGLAKLRELGVKKVFDLRSEPEIKRQGPEWKGVDVDAGAFVTRDGDKAEVLDEGAIERVWCPVFASTDYGPESVALRYKQYALSGSEAGPVADDGIKGFVQAYKDIMVNGPNAYNVILSHLAQPDPQPCIVHCTAGKDRTGVLVALLYLLCDVPGQIIANEYSLTDKGLAHLKPLFKERLLQNPALAGNEEGVDNMISSKSQNMAATIDMIKEQYGSAEAYVREVVGLNDDQVARLKKNLKSDEPPVLPRQ
ncbi:hypothetical protein MBLNU459_g2152t1 [Dothideomycetes sp. NU459]